MLLMILFMVGVLALFVLGSLVAVVVLLHRKPRGTSTRGAHGHHAE